MVTIAAAACAASVVLSPGGLIVGCHVDAYSGVLQVHNRDGSVWLHLPTVRLAVTFDWVRRCGFREGFEGGSSKMGFAKCWRQLRGAPFWPLCGELYLLYLARCIVCHTCASGSCAVIEDLLQKRVY